MAKSLFRTPYLLCTLVVCFFWKLWLTDRYTWLQSPDFANQLLPWYQFQASEWHAGRIPLWNPYEWAGQSLIGQAQPGVVDPLNLLFLYAWPLNANGWIRQHVLHGFFIAGYVCVALAFYALCRRGLRSSRAASVFAALAFALGGIPSSTSWPQMMHATIWGPLGLLFQILAVREDKPLRHAALSGTFLGLMWLSGHHQIPIYFTLASVFLWLYFLYTRFVTRPWLLRSAAVSGLFLILFGALQILPMAEYGRNALRWAGTADPVGWADLIPHHVHRQFSMTPLGLVSLVLRTAESYEPYMGVTAVILAGIGLAAFWRQCETARWLTAAGVIAILFALGANSFLHGMMYALVPAVEKARVPAVAMVLANLAIAALAAYGLDHLRKSQLPHRTAARITGAFALGTAAFVIWFLARYRYLPGGWTFLVIALAAVALAFRLPARFRTYVLTAALLLELSGFTGDQWEDQHAVKREHFLEELGRHADIGTYLQRAPGDFRVHHKVEDLPFSFGDYWGFETLEAFTASVPAPLWNLDAFDPALRDFASVRYHVAREAPSPAHIERFRSRTSDLKIYENPGAYPRAWLVHRARTVESIKEAKDWMKGAGPAKRTEAVLIAQPAPVLDACPGALENDEVEILRRLPGEIRVRVKTSCRAMLVLNDSWDPGWKARIDGRTRAPILQVSGYARGVVVDAGTHELRVYYLPDSVLAGLVCLGLGAAGLALVFFLTKGRGVAAQA